MVLYIHKVSKPSLIVVEILNYGFILFYIHLTRRLWQQFLDFRQNWLFDILKRSWKISCLELKNVALSTKYAMLYCSDKYRNNNNNIKKKQNKKQKKNDYMNNHCLPIISEHSSHKFFSLCYEIVHCPIF